ncbi:MAG: TerB family tellurite resistance protein [Deltaproteobacteria bacterium]|nr:TerB family tellurite resistance protein [Deltaproteobacteria bacterium]
MIYFIVIYGTYGITYSKGAGGQFGCPGCQAPQGYRHRRVRRFFHIFFIPLIPLNLAGEYVECTQCKGTYKLDVLDATRMLGHGLVSEQYRATRRLLVLMMLADGRVDEAELATIASVLRGLDGREVSRDELIAEIEAARREPSDVEAFCRTVMGYLNEQGRQAVLRGAHAVANADGHIDPSEHQLLERIGIALGLKPGQVTSSLGAPHQPTAQQPYAPTSGHAPTAQQPYAQQAQPQQGYAPMQHAQAPQRFCPACGAQGRWMPDHQRWGCDSCRSFLP